MGIFVSVCIPLRDVEHVFRRGLVQPASVDGPQAAEDPEEGTFPTAVRTCDQQVHVFLHLKKNKLVKMLRVAYMVQDRSSEVTSS